jgi:hypothetical protein
VKEQRLAQPPLRFEDIESLYCGSVYPSPDVYMQGCSTALAIFCAQWYGTQDAYWLARAGLDVTFVDEQAEKLAVMRELYPGKTSSVVGDAYEYAKRALDEGLQWDVVNLDPWTSQFDQCAKLIDTWTTLARKVVVLGHGNYRLTAPEAPEGWQHALTIRRSDFKGGVNWLVFTRD